MTQNVYMASMIFLVPLNKLSGKYKKFCTRKRAQGLSSPPALYPHAQCMFWGFCDEYNSFPTIAQEFSFKSHYRCSYRIDREIKVEPFLVELVLDEKRGCQYILVLQVSIDKVFHKGQSLYKNSDFCTEFDLVNLKKAFFETCGLHTYHNGSRINQHDWLELLLCELEGSKRKSATFSYSIIDICVQNLNITVDSNTYDRVLRDFQEGYYNNSCQFPMDGYLQQPILLQGNSTTLKASTITEDFFVYGLLYANDNFMMADSRDIQRVVGNFYSNNKVERFWADDESIVHIKTHTPFYHDVKHDKQELKCWLNEVQCLPEMCMLIYLKCCLQDFKKKHKELSAEEIEDNYGRIAEMFHEKLFNQTEMDKRMDYFIKQSRLPQRLDEIHDIATPRKNFLEIIFLHKINIWILVISLLTLIVTIISLFKH